MSELRLFKPADCVEGRAFETVWCENCKGNMIGRNICPILCNAAFSFFDPTDAEYPSEWRIGEDGPECVAFEPALRAVGFDRAAFERQGFAKGDAK